jgi:hypothetical protein
MAAGRQKSYTMWHERENVVAYGCLPFSPCKTDKNIIK